MYSPTHRYTRTDGLRLRPVPELGCCLVFTPGRPNLYTLNARAWLVLELVQATPSRPGQPEEAGRPPGQTGAELEAAYREALRERHSEASGEGLAEIIDDLALKGILRRIDSEETP